ncbi:hypothetical protein VTI74DRAFT_10094 [Chaetomium olivicolor]
MPPALALGRALNWSRALPAQLKPPSICIFCSSSPSRRSPSSLPTLLRSSTKHLDSLPRIQRRHQSTTTTASSRTSNPRTDLHRALLDLQSHAPNQINLPRLQLALRNLSEPPGHESVRVAFLSVSSQGTNPTATAKRLLRLALADPLKPVQAWETLLERHDTAGTKGKALVVRVGADSQQYGKGGVEDEGLRTDEHVVPELRVSSPPLNGAGLELLVADVGAVLDAEVAAGAVQVMDDTILVPTVDVAATTAGHAALIGTPVHMALLVGDGVLGAGKILGLPVLEGREIIAGAVNFTKVGKEDLVGCPVMGINVDAGSEGLKLFREDVRNAMKYEALWSEAGISRVSEWLRKGVLPTSEGATKPAVRNLISSLLRNARAAIQEGEASDVSTVTEIHTKVSPDVTVHLEQALSEWAQNAHQELQQQLDVAFNTRPWNKLGWWKLVWRADDVAMVTSELVAQRFLPGTEKSLIYLTGRIQEAGVVEGQQGQPRYPGPTLPSQLTGTERHDTVAPTTVNLWPTHIPFTRNYLQERTVPALQALAQKLVVQSASVSGLTSLIAGLTYLAGYGTYECGAIAALGIAWSCRRLQKKWNAARVYWEGEVREEGRKAIRATEASVAEVLDQAGKTPEPKDADREAELEELRKAEEIIKRAEDALARMK